MRYIALFLLIMLVACKSTKQVEMSAVESSDSTKIDISQKSENRDESIAILESLAIDSLDVWVYEWPVECQANQVLTTPDTLFGIHMPAKATHVTARKISLGKSGLTEIHTQSDSLSHSIVSAHSDHSESTEQKSNTIAVAKPPGLSLFLLIAIGMAAIVIVYKYRRK